MAEAGKKPIPSGASISISEAAGRVLQFYPAQIAGPTMRQALAAGRIPLSYRELVGHRPPDPTPDMPAFWRNDLRGKVHLTPFPWVGDWVRRHVHACSHRRPLCDYTALGLTVMWKDVVAIFPACETKQKSKRGRKSKFGPDKIESYQKRLYDLLDRNPSWAKYKQERLAGEVIKNLHLDASWRTVWRYICEPVLRARSK